MGGIRRPAGMAAGLVHFLRKTFSGFLARLVLCFIICSIIPILIVGGVGYVTSLRIAEERIMESVKLSHNQMAQNLNTVFNQMERVCDSSQNYLYVLLNKPVEPFSEYVDYFTYARRSISALNDNFRLFKTCAFLPENMFVSNEGLMFYPIDALLKYGIEPRELTGIGISSKWLFREKVTFPVVLVGSGGPADLILCCQSFSNASGIHYAVFSSVLSGAVSDQLRSIAKGIPTANYLLTQEGVIAAHTGENMAGARLAAEKFGMIRQVESGMIYLNRDPVFIDRLSNGFYLVSEIPHTYITDKTLGVIQVTLFTFLLMIPMAIIVNIIVSKTLVKKIIILSSSINSVRVSGSMITLRDIRDHFRIDSPYRDEIDSLAAAYVDMVRALQKNINDILDLSVKEERLKYQVLQSRINPHFLYNILGSIQTCYSFGQTEIAEQMIRDLTKFYRLLLRKDRDLIPIREETEIAALYLQIEALCRRGTLTWNIGIEEGAGNFMICKFVLQPFLENSLLHGFVPPRQTMHIDIRVSYEDDKVLVVIADNGVGMEESRLEELRERLKEKDVSDHGGHMGIANVNARISSPLFGSGKVRICSVPGEGVTVTLEMSQIVNEAECP
jgi:two-component system sensor histidine kinase YesM